MSHFFEFGGLLYNCGRDVADAIATEWMTAGGLNDAAFIVGKFAKSTDDELAGEVISAWRFDEPANENDDTISWMDERDIDRADISRAFGRLRSEYPVAD